MTIGRLLTTQVTVLRPGSATDEYNAAALCPPIETAGGIAERR
jgi:hypothetical protein